MFVIKLNLSSSRTQLLACIYVAASLGDNLVLYVHEAVILNDTFASAGTARLEMSGPDTNGKIGDKVIGRLARAMGDENAPSIAVCLLSAV